LSFLRCKYVNSSGDLHYTTDDDSIASLSIYISCLYSGVSTPISDDVRKLDWFSMCTMKLHAAKHKCKKCCHRFRLRL